MFVPPHELVHLFARLFPLRPNRAFGSRSLDELRKTYRKWDYFGIAAFFVLVPGCIYGLHEVFTRYAELGVEAADKAVYILRPNPAFWYAPAAVLGVILACLLVSLLYRLLLGDRAAEYRYYANLSAGMNARGMYLAFGVLLGLGFAAIAAFAAHSYLRLNESGIAFRRIWSLEGERYPYTQIRGLREVRHSGSGTTDFVIEFEGAEAWSTAVEVVFPGPREKAFLASRSGKPIETNAAD